MGNSSTVEHRTLNSQNLGSNPSSPAKGFADIQRTFALKPALEKWEQCERTAHIGGTEVGTADPSNLCRCRAVAHLAGR